MIEEVHETFSSTDGLDEARLSRVDSYQGHHRTYLEVESHSDGYDTLFEELTTLSYVAEDYDNPVRLCFIQNGRNTDNRVCRLSLGTYEDMDYERRRGQIPNDVRFVG